MRDDNSPALSEGKGTESAYKQSVTRCFYGDVNAFGFCPAFDNTTSYEFESVYCIGGGDMNGLLHKLWHPASE